MSTKKLISSTFYYGVIPKLTILVNVLILPIITPYLSTSDYGIQGIVASYTALFLAIAPMGLHVHLTNSFYEYPGKYHLIWGRILFLHLLLGGIYGLINMIVLMLVLPPMVIRALVLLCFIGSVQIFLMSNNILASHLFPIVERPKPLVFTNLMAACIGIVASFVLIYYFKLGFWGLIAQPAVSTIVAFGVFAKFVCNDYNIWPIIEKKWKRLKEFFRIALPLVPHALGFALLTSSARIIMSLQKVPNDEIGLFSHGCIMGDYAIIITSALATALVAPIQKSYRSGNFDNFRRLYYLCQGVAIVASSLFCIWIPEIYGLLIHNESLSLSANIASLICFANVVMPLYTFMSTSAFIEKRTKQVLWLVFVPGFINLLLCLICMPIWGYKAAVYATIISYWTQMLIPFVINYFKIVVGQWIGNLTKLIVILLLMLFMLIISNVVSGYTTLIRLFLSLLLVSLFVYWYVSRKVYQIT